MYQTIPTGSNASIKILLLNNKVENTWSSLTSPLQLNTRHKRRIKITSVVILWVCVSLVSAQSWTETRHQGGFFWHRGKWKGEKKEKKSPWLVHLLFNGGIKFLSLNSLTLSVPQQRNPGGGRERERKKTNKEKTDRWKERGIWLTVINTLGKWKMATGNREQVIEKQLLSPLCVWETFLLLGCSRWKEKNTFPEFFWVELVSCWCLLVYFGAKNVCRKSS